MRLIDADEFENFIQKNCADSLVDLWCELVRRQPTIEAVPVVHGEWKEYEEVGSRGYHYCSKCYYPAFKRDFCGRSIESLSNFCPNCGADMRKGGAE